MTERKPITIIGGGLAGSEAAWQVATRGMPVILYEMRPQATTPAHKTDMLAELVCSNSLGSDLEDRAPGVLKRELRRLGSLILDSAEQARVPAGGALAVGREDFARAVTDAIEQHPLITLRREEVTRLPEQGITIVATGPLTSPALAKDIARLAGQQYLSFYDAMAPIVSAESIDMTKCFRADRYDRGEGDYINCPMTREEYSRFVDELLRAETFPLREFEAEDRRFFEACLPVEVLAARGYNALAYGPLKPVGLRDPRTGQRPYAVVQLRQDNLAGTLYNLVGFQTNLKWPEQKRVFGLIPGLEQAEWVRFGQMHRNTFINSPALLEPTMRWRTREGLYFAGQIVGTEGYVGSTASGLLAGINAARAALGEGPVIFPRTTILGALAYYVTHTQEDDFQPMKANWAILPPLEPSVRNKRARYAAYAERARRDLDEYITAEGILDDITIRQTP
ncbi:MAG: methylenetetrahydrofolate--tRNA-(uracil(54)-C(5))-methyltransferase (FADH(2)-oxidizing) TrmFO [Chloroflexi bacterium]|jgi:methylenetetrahydrofolate--tRNA-(uracil-5-)-methyltransferase|nr:methylenetetrahydrofolate--tRNA-(uracil(54)-C(5))-methyltransferase (FADH(2)-oxidizing) TrmFO [Chloroflexota bacterium]